MTDAGPPASHPKHSPYALYVTAGVIVVAAWLMLDRGERPIVAVTLPPLSERAIAGCQIFNRLCVECHGMDAGGGTKGPPLIRKIYEPGHHPDEAFRAAVAAGVRQHHSKFGNMPSQPQITPDQVEAIIAFIRETQRANGIP